MSDDDGEDSKENHESSDSPENIADIREVARMMILSGEVSMPDDKGPESLRKVDLLCNKSYDDKTMAYILVM